MELFRALRFVFSFCLVVALPACAQTRAPTEATAALAPLPRFMPTGEFVAPPSGFIDFCRRNKSDCDGGGASPVELELTSERWAELNAVNDEVNGFPEISDEANYGQREYWTYAGANGGDCEDLALQKRQLLIEKGWPADALLLTVVTAWEGAGHAVLLVATDRDEYVLDNKNWAIISWRDAPYAWIKRQSRERPSVWVGVDAKAMQVAETASLK